MLVERLFVAAVAALEVGEIGFLPQAGGGVGEDGHEELEERGDADGFVDEGNLLQVGGGDVEEGGKHVEEAEDGG